MKIGLGSREAAKNAKKSTAKAKSAREDAEPRIAAKKNKGKEKQGVVESAKRCG